MPEYKIIFDDDQDKIAQKALAARNEYLKNAALPTLTIDQFLQESMETTLRCSLADVASYKRGDVMQVLLTSMDKVPTDKIPQVIAAAEAAATVTPLVPPK